jgi:hypothetical protein
MNLTEKKIGNSHNSVKFNSIYIYLFTHQSKDQSYSKQKEKKNITKKIQANKRQKNRNSLNVESNNISNSEIMPTKYYALRIYCDVYTHF